MFIEPSKPVKAVNMRSRDWGMAKLLEVELLCAVATYLRLALKACSQCAFNHLDNVAVQGSEEECLLLLKLTIPDSDCRVHYVRV